MYMKQKCRSLSGLRKLVQEQSAYSKPKSYRYCLGAIILMQLPKLIKRLWVYILSLLCIDADEPPSIERDSFLPSAIQRYHQLLMPTLELIVALLSILGTKHTTVVNQVSKPVLGLQLILTRFLGSRIPD